VAISSAAREGWLKRILDKKNFDWKKLNENQFISKFEDRLLIELPVDEKDLSFSIFKAEWTKEIYDLMKGN
jgi:hypothetical protein